MKKVRQNYRHGTYKKVKDKIIDTAFTILWVLGNLFTLGGLWFVYRVIRKAVADGIEEGKTR